MCDIKDWEGYCEECHMVGEHDRRCPVLAELRQERADHLLDCQRDEEALAGWVAEGDASTSSE